MANPIVVAGQGSGEAELPFGDHVGDHQGVDRAGTDRVDPFNADLTRLIGELSTRSDDFRTRWARHEVRLHHPIIGELTLDDESMDLHADPGLNLTVYTAAPDTPAHDALRLPAGWAATLDAADDTETGSSRLPHEEPATRD
ncbi:hypothetical protein ACFYY8_37740 [Streptosporangium sp. NPDC001559]|uniref:MmyB family transcriptional regulator n=1 Tax=Streptosporangium sp. NPDC001559 TaxID=3366187 RepID=UPI0036EF4F6C